MKAHIKNDYLYNHFLFLKNESICYLFVSELEIYLFPL